MKKLTKYLSRNCTIMAVASSLMFLMLPVKLVIILSIGYCVISGLGMFKTKFPDVWDLDENEGDSEKTHKTFLSFPTLVDGSWHVFRYVNQVIVNGKTTLSL